MKKITRQWKWIVLAAVILVVVMCALAFFLMILLIPWNSWEGTSVQYGEKSFSSNEKYLGTIDMDNEKVTILTHSGERVSFLDMHGNYPHQITLGKNSYFLLYSGENEDAKIVQYDYQSNKMKECTVSDVASISCQGGFLFVGDMQEDEDDDVYCCMNSFHNGYCVNRYIEEENFGGELQTLALDREGRCLMGDTELYYHDQGEYCNYSFFSTEPVLEDYPGISLGNFGREDKSNGYQAVTRQEKENRSLLLKAITGKEGIPYPEYVVREYQKDHFIYGVCNVFEEYIAARPDEPEDVAKAFFYKIDPSKDEITILAQEDSCIAMIVSDSVAVYQRDDEIVRQDLSSGEEKILYKIKNTHYLVIYIKEDYLQINEEKKRFLPFLFPTEEETSILIRWN